jgi:Tfp pilus assembly protein PilF
VGGQHRGKTVRDRLRFRAGDERQALVVLVPAILSISYRGVFRDPVAHWTRAVRMWPESSDALFNFGVALSDIPESLSRAVDAFQRAIRLDPGVSAYHDNLGVASGRQGLLREAAGEFRAAMALDNSDALPYNNMGFAEYLLGDHDAAERSWIRALAHDSTFVEPATKPALLYRSEGRWVEARVYARRLRRQGAALDSGLIRLAEEADSTRAIRR